MQSIYKALKFNFGKTLLAAVLLIAGMQSGYGQCSTVILQEISPVNLCSGTEKTLTPTISGRTAGSGNFIQSGTNGAAIDCNCPEGYVAVGYKGKAGNGVLAQWSLACQKMNRNGTLDSNIVYTQSTGTAAGFDLAPIIASNSALTQIDAYAYTSNYVSLVQGQATPISSIISGTPVGTSYLNPLGQSSTHQLGSSAAPPGCVITGITTGNTGFASGFKVNYKPMAYFTGSFLWSSGDTTAAITITQPAAYAVIYTNRFNCAGVSNTINVLVDTVTITAGGNTTLCQGDSVMLTASPGSSYQWSTGETTQSIVAKTPGNYSVTHGGLCSASQVVTYGTPTTISLNGPSTICPGNSITLTANYGSAFIWSTGETTASITVSAAGTYTVTATVNNSCGMQVASQLINVAPLEIPTLSAPYTGLAFCNFNGSVEIWVGANPRYAGYTWSSNVAYTSALRDIAGVGGPGTYSVTVNDVFGCTVPGSIDITGPIDSSAFFGEGVWRVSAWQGGDGTAGAGAWHDNYAGYYIDTAFSINTTNIWNVWGSPGDAPGYNGCSIYGGNPLSYSSKRHGFPCGLYRLSIPQAAGTTQLLVNGILVWTNRNPGDGATNVWTGILDATSFVEYRAAVAYDESYQMLSINPETALSIITDGPALVCTGGSLTLSSSAQSGNYLWSTGQTTSRITISQGGTYSVTVSGNGCTGTGASITIIQSPVAAPVATLSASAHILCSYDPFTLSCSTNEHYLWSTGDTSQSIQIGRPGNYVVSVTNAVGCWASSNTYAVTMSTPAGPTAGVAGNTCPNSSAILTASGMAPGGQVLDFSNDEAGRSVEVMQDLPEHNFTIEMWVKTTSANCGIYSVTNGGADHDRHLYLYNGQLWCRVWSANGWNSGVTLNDGSWHHVALTVADGIGQKIYVDGILAPNSNSYDHSEFNWQDRFWLGYSIDAIDHYFKGYMDNVRIWSRALDVSEIHDNMTLETPLSSNGLIYHAALNGTLNAAIGPNGTGNGTITYANADYYTYTWTGPGAPAPSTSENQSTGALVADATYSVVASAAGCSGQASTVSVTLIAAPTVVAQADQTSICAGENVTLTGTGNATSYSWNNAVPDGEAFIPTATATYIVTGVNNLGCSSRDSVQVTVNQPVSNAIATSICQGENYAGHTTAGTYTDHYTSAAGCDSARTLVLSVIPVTSSTIAVSICDGGNFEGYTTTGTYTDHYINAGGCDSIRTLVLSVIPVTSSTISATICEGENYDGHTATGTYTDHYINSGGCDSARTLVLSVIPVTSSTISATICEGENYAGHTAIGTYTDYYINSGDCDSARTLVLSVIPVTSSTVSATICAGENYAGYSTSGTYTDHYTNAGGCDSTRTLVLNVIPVVTSTISATICEGGSYEGYSITGIYTDHYTSAGGCDSARTLNLNVLSPVTSTISATICEGGNYEGYYYAGTYTDYYTSTGGCDSTRILLLSVIPPVTSTVYINICRSSSYAGYSLPGIYVDHFISAAGCDSIRTLVLNNINLTASVTATICQGENYAGHSSTGFYVDQYVTADGCDSTRTLALTVSSPPNIICPVVPARNALPTLCGAPVNFLANAFGSPTPVITYSQQPGTIFNVGTTNVTVTATSQGCARTCTFPVVVNDITPPSIICPNPVGVSADQATCNKTLSIPAPITSDNCGVASIINDFNNTANASGIYPVGTTVIQWTVYDIHNLSRTCQQFVKVYPCIQLSASATNTICTGTANGSVTATATDGVGGFSYLWSTGGTTATINNLAPGTYSVTVTDLAGGSATASTAVGTTIPAMKPATPGVISGAVSVCGNATNTYSVAAVPLAGSYTWTVPANVTILSGQGTNQVTVQFAATFSSGTLSVQASNCKGISAKSNLALHLLTLPARPASITGNTSVCAGNIETYTAATVAGATSYTWTTPNNAVIRNGQGTNVVMVQYQPGFASGSLSVTADNCMGSSAARTLLVNPVPVPATPSVITGTTAICIGQIYQYQVTQAANVGAYNWSVPANAILMMGQGTNAIFVLYQAGYTGAAITVYGTNCSGNGPVRSLTVNPAPVPSTPSAITGTAAICPAQTYQYQVMQAANVLEYTWSVPANAAIISGQGSNAITVQYQAGYTGGAVSVYGTNCSGNGSVRNLTVNPAPVPTTPSAITGTAAICLGQTYQYQVTQAANVVAYTWSVPANAAIISGQGSNAVTVEFQAGYTGGAVSVYGTNCSGNGPVRNLSVNLLALPARPAAIAGTAVVCPDITYQYTITPVTNALSYTWSLPTGATLLSGDGTTGISVSYSSSFSGGSIGVYATGCSGNGLVRTLTVNKLAVPARPAAITGATPVCVGSTYSYQIPAVTNATSYTWNLPANASLVDGQGTTNVTVSFSGAYTGGIISVYASDCSGNGLVRELTVNKLAIPAKPSAITGTAAVCQNGTYQYQITAVTNAVSYTWAVPATATIQSGQGTPVITVSYSGTFTGGPVTVYASNCSGNGAVQTKAITKTTTGCASAKTDGTEDGDKPEAIREEDQQTGDFKVKLFPNPFKNQFTVHLDGLSEEQLSIEVYGINGQLLDEIKTHFAGSDITMGEKLPAGVYVVKIRQGEHSKALRLVKTE